MIPFLDRSSTSLVRCRASVELDGYSSSPGQKLLYYPLHCIYISRSYWVSPLSDQSKVGTVERTVALVLGCRLILASIAHFSLWHR